MKKWAILIVAVVMVFTLSPQASHATEAVGGKTLFDGKFSHIKNVMLLPVNMPNYRQTAGGVLEEFGEWTDQATSNLTNAVIVEFGKRGDFKLQHVARQSMDKEKLANLDETMGLYRRIKKIIRDQKIRERSAFQQDSPPYIQNGQDFCLGSEVRDLSMKADALLIVDGYVIFETKGKALRRIGTSVIGLAAGAVVMEGKKGTMISLTLVDAQTGNILWHTDLIGTRTRDLRITRIADNMARHVLNRLFQPQEN